MRAYSTQVDGASHRRTVPECSADWYYIWAKMKITLERTAWILAVAGAVVFIVGGALGGDTLSRIGLIAALTGVAWAIGLRTRGRS